MMHQRLPHIDLPDTYQFITFRTHDSMDDLLRKLSRSNEDPSLTQLRIDNHLDQSNKGAYLVGDVLEFFCQFLMLHDGQRYELVASAVMPNHVHLLLKPNMAVADLMRLVKGASAKYMNKKLGRSGRFWAKDYFDRGIRDDKHFKVVYRYIRNNPLKLQSCNRDNRFYGVYGDDLC